MSKLFQGVFFRVRAILRGILRGILRPCRLPHKAIAMIWRTPMTLPEALGWAWAFRRRAGLPAATAPTGRVRGWISMFLKLAVDQLISWSCWSATFSNKSGFPGDLTNSKDLSRSQQISGLEIFPWISPKIPWDFQLTRRSQVMFGAGSKQKSPRPVFFLIRSAIWSVRKGWNFHVKHVKHVKHHVKHHVQLVTWDYLSTYLSFRAWNSWSLRAALRICTRPLAFLALRWATSMWISRWSRWSSRCCQSVSPGHPVSNIESWTIYEPNIGWFISIGNHLFMNHLNHLYLILGLWTIYSCFFFDSRNSSIFYPTRSRRR